MVTLIINADDLGYNEPRTRAIFDFFRRGLVSNTTLMVNLPYADAAVARAKELGLADRVGLHLNLTEGFPLSEEIRECRLFCDDSGKFNSAFLRHPIYRVWLPRKAHNAVRAEIVAQLEKFLDYGLPQRHIDSHNHVHTFLPVLGELVRIARQYGFTSIRQSMNLRVGGYCLLKRCYKILVNNQLRSFPKQSDFFCDFWTIPPMKDFLSDKVVEVMTHPLRCEDGYGDSSYYDGGYETKDYGLVEMMEQYHGEFLLDHY